MSDVQFSKGANVPGKSVDTIVDSLLSCVKCSDCGTDLGLHCTHRHVGIVSVVMTCGCEPNVRMHKEPTTQTLLF